MAFSEKDVFSFTWQIENFNMCKPTITNPLSTPIFLVFGAKWYLELYFRESWFGRLPSCYLIRKISIDKDDSVTIGMEFIVHSVHSKKVIRFKEKYHIFDLKNYRASIIFPFIGDFFNTKNGFLPNNTLTMECCLWLITDKEDVHIPTVPVLDDSYLAFDDSSLRKEMLTTAVRNEALDIQTHFSPNQYLVCTHVVVSKKCIIWPIGRFLALRPNQRVSIPILPTDAAAPSFAMTLFLSGEFVDDQNVTIEIRILKSDLTKVIFVRCRITAINCSMKAQHVAEDEHSFNPTKKKDVWKFPTFIKMNTLLKDKYVDSTHGTLNLRCEFTFSSEGDHVHIEYIDPVPFLNLFPNSVREEFNEFQCMSKKVYERQKFCDVVLRTGDRSFKAHKNILSARSSVFRAMFERDMSENESEIVKIIDYDPDTIEQLLAFIYTNSLVDLQQENAMKLYSVADKYEVLSLKWHCSSYLKSTLSISNLCEILTLADLHQDVNLLDHIKNFIHLNAQIILHSHMWKDLMKSNAPLASQVMFDLLTGKTGYL